MSKIGLNFSSIISAASESGKSIDEILATVKFYGVSSLDAEYETLISNEQYFAAILRSGIAVSSVYTFMNLGGSSDVSKALEITDYCKNNKIKQIMFLAEPIENFDDADKIYFLIKQNLRRIVNYALNFNISVTVENMFGMKNPFASLKNVISILKGVKNLGLVFDAGNCVLSGEDTIEFLDSCMPYLKEIHAKDLKLGVSSDDETKFLPNNESCYICESGGGIAKIEEIIKKSISVYPDIRIVAEFSSKQKNIINYIEKSVEFIYSAIKE